MKARLAAYFNTWLGLGRRPAEPAGTALQGLDTDTRRAAIPGVLALVIGFFGFVIWAAYAPLDEGVPASGHVTVESQRKAIQHLRGGLVKEIRVRDGSQVRAQDILVVLNDTEARAQLDIAQAQYWTALATQSRLSAERDRTEAIVFPSEIRASGDTRAREAMRVQGDLFMARRDALASQWAILEENLKGLQEQINGLRALESGKQTQIKLLTDELESIRGLVQQGFYPRMKLLEMERTLAELAGSRGDDLANIARTHNAIAELKLRQVQLRQDFLKEVQESLARAQEERLNLRDRITALREEVDRSKVRSPVDGVVVGLAIHTLGGVIQPGQVLMEIVPGGEAMMIEVRIPPHLIEKIRPELSADIRFSTVTGGQLPPIEGMLTRVSADRLVDPATGGAYYLGRVAVTPAGLALLHRSGHTIQPGMPVDVVIKTGERTLLDYLIAPLKNRIAGSLKET